MVKLRGVHRAHDGDVVGHLAQLRQELGDHGARLTPLLEFVGRAEQARDAADESKFLTFQDVLGNLVPAELLELGLVVEQVKLRGRARHEKVNDAFGLGGEHGRLGGHGIPRQPGRGVGKNRFVEERGQGRPA